MLLKDFLQQFEGLDPETTEIDRQLLTDVVFAGFDFVIVIEYVIEGEWT